jgi:hypothetical protein
VPAGTQTVVELSPEPISTGTKPGRGACTGRRIQVAQIDVLAAAGDGDGAAADDVAKRTGAVVNSRFSPEPKACGYETWAEAD